MATAAEIQEQIREAEAELVRRRAAQEAASQEVAAANERQRLRRELDKIQRRITTAEYHERYHRRYRTQIDAAQGGD